MSSRPATRRRLVQDGLVAAQDRFADRAGWVRRRARRRGLWAAVAVIVVAALAWLLLASPVLAVRSVEVTGVHGKAGRAEVRRLADVSLGTPLARVDTGAVESRVAAAADVAHVSVDRRWPGTLVVDATTRTPVLAVRGDSGALKVVDIEGVAFATVERAPTGVPVIHSDTGTVSRAGVSAALDVLSTLPRGLADRVTDLGVSAADVVTFSIGSTDVVWGTAERPELKSEVVAALLERHPHVIDVSAPDTPVTR